MTLSTKEIGNIKLLYFSFLFSEQSLLIRGCNQLGQFLTHRETNLRYVSLEFVVNSTQEPC